MKIVVTIKQTETATIDIGSLPINLIRDLLQKNNDGTFNGNWAIADAARDEKWTVDSIEVVEA